MTSTAASLIALSIVAANAREVAPAETAGDAPTCRYHVLPPITALVRGAAKQRLRIRADDRQECALDAKLGRRIVGAAPAEPAQEKTGDGTGATQSNSRGATQDAGRERNIVWLTLDEGAARYSVPGTVVDAKSGIIEFAPIPSALPMVERPWRLTSATREAYGEVAIGVTEISIEQEVRPEAAQDLDIKNLVAPPARFALANRLPGESAPDRWAIKNRVRVNLPEAIQPVPQAWGIHHSTWGAKVRFEGCKAFGSVPGGEAAEGCTLTSAGQKSIPFSFEVLERRADPLVLELAYFPVAGQEAWLVASVDLAAGAAVATAPLPLAPALAVSCPRSRAAAMNNTLIAVPEKELRMGECVLVLDQGRFASRLQRMRPLYGPQTVTVSVHHPGAEADGEATWTIDPASIETIVSIPLPLPDRDQMNLEPYIVKAVVTTGASAATLPNTPTRGGAATDGYTFAARIRSRGEYGLWSPMRVFATIPVDITGLRFPANPRDLKSSSDSTVYQATQLRTGLLFGAEPWDYAANGSLWAIPVRALAGFYFFDLSNVTFTPSAVAGVSATVPLVQGPSQLGTTLGLGAFYEFDLKDSKPLRTGHRFLISFGFNVFALSSGK